MDTRQRFEIRLAPEAEKAFLALPGDERAHLKSIIEGIAEVSALAPPQFPAWFRRYGLAAPLMRMTVAGMQISFEIDAFEGAIRICNIETSYTPRATIGAVRERNEARIGFL